MIRALFVFTMAKKWYWKAILGGLAVDIVGSQIVGAVIAIPFSVVLASHGMPPAQIATALVSSRGFLVSGALLGLFMDFLGGYATAAWAPQRKIANSLVMGILSFVSGLLLNGTSSTSPLWFRMSMLFVIPAALLGGWWRVKTRGAESVDKPEDGASGGSPPIASPF